MGDERQGREVLEAQLRNMILGNVQMGGNQQAPSTRGRWRGSSGHGYRQAGDHQNGQQNQRGRGGHGYRGRGDGSDTTGMAQQTEGSHRGRGGHGRRGARPSHYEPLQRSRVDLQQIQEQAMYLEKVFGYHIPNFEMSAAEFEAKNSFRLYLQDVLQRAASRAYSPPPSVYLEIFGSLNSGFAMPGSDMDLALISYPEYPDIFRLYQLVLLEIGIGARLLTRTRVPILKICELPTPEILEALREDRAKWDAMTPEERLAHDTGTSSEKDKQPETAAPETNGKPEANTENGTAASDPISKDAATPAKTKKKRKSIAQKSELVQKGTDETNLTASPQIEDASKTTADAASKETVEIEAKDAKPKKPRQTKRFLRHKKLGPLDFPSSGVGIQCDINYANPLGIHNTALLRCYSASDIRVRLMVLSIKGWASRRKINSSYNGTLSSYGYVLMVLHYLVNIAQPPVCPNLQLRVKPQGTLPIAANDLESCMGFDVRFWRDERAITELANSHSLTQNREPLGSLLRGFFHYFAFQGAHIPHGGFNWMNQILSLRTSGGLLYKQDKGWTGAKTVDVEGREVRNRYLFAIEDPFEITHNVARTVTHPGICLIRDEFRRASNLIERAGRGESIDDLMELVVEAEPEQEPEPAVEGETEANVLNAAEKRQNNVETIETGMASLGLGSA